MLKLDRLRSKEDSVPTQVKYRSRQRRFCSAELMERTREILRGITLRRIQIVRESK